MDMENGDTQRLHEHEAARLQPELRHDLGRRRRHRHAAAARRRPSRCGSRPSRTARSATSSTPSTTSTTSSATTTSRAPARSSTTRASTSASWSSTRSSTRSPTPTSRSPPAAKGTDLDDPEGVALWPDRDEYYRDPNKGTIVFTGDLTLRVGDHTFNLLHTPGHTPGQLAVHVPEERVVFTGDTIFSGCQTWLMTSNVEQWLAALERIRTLDVDWIVPGHGPVVAEAVPRRPALPPDGVEDGRRRRRSPRAGRARRRSPGSTSRTASARSTSARATCSTTSRTCNAGALYDKLTGAVPGA